MRLLPSGERAVLVELGSLEEVLALVDAVRRLAGVEDVVPGERTLLVTVAKAGDLQAVRQLLPGMAGFGRPDGLAAPRGDDNAIQTAKTPSSRAAQTLVVPVVYDGPDLDDVAAHTGLSVAGLVAAHTGTPWRVAFGGFAPGFAYLVGGDPRLEVPRRPEPRATVPTGSVGLAGRYSGVYPRSSPGGWQLIGRTDLVLFDPDREPPALLQPGTTVQFVAHDG
ncbi:MAG: allophanate hydrolase subunit 1 [Actinobacteria bacterium]|nr:allophanate hydrolase subunit 1 [Actinomycetota bacterium]